MAFLVLARERFFVLLLESILVFSMGEFLARFGTLDKRMVIKTNKILVVDLEATCWAEKNPRRVGEIIEIGICLVNLKERKIERSGSFVVRPLDLDISPYCTELTGWTLEDIKKGYPLGDVLNTIGKEYPLASCAWASWGDYDRQQLQRECWDKCIEYPFSDTHLNLKFLHAIINGMSHGTGMAKALKGYNIELIGRHHRGLDDSINTARLLIKMLEK